MYLEIVDEESATGHLNVAGQRIPVREVQVSDKTAGARPADFDTRIPCATADGAAVGDLLAEPVISAGVEADAVRRALIVHPAGITVPAGSYALSDVDEDYSAEPITADERRGILAMMRAPLKP